MDSLALQFELGKNRAELLQLRITRKEQAIDEILTRGKIDDLEERNTALCVLLRIPLTEEQKITWKWLKRKVRLGL